MSNLYLDNAATSYPKAPLLYERSMELYQEFGVNASRGKYSLAQKMGKVDSSLRTKLASIFNIVDKTKIIITPSATISLNQIIQGLDYSKIKNVYISPFEHNAVYRPILHMQKLHGFNLEIIPFDKFDWNSSKTKIFFDSKNPDLVILNHASNVFGNILPVKEIFSLAKQYDATTALDTAQTAGLINTDMKELQADFAAFAGHKTFYGPSGIGGFVINSDIKLNPILFGGTGINSEETDMPESYPERFEVGSMNALGIIGLDLSLTWLEGIGIDNIRKQKEDNFKALLETLKGFDDEIELIYGEPNIGIVSCCFADYSPQEIAILLDQAGVSTRSGLHCAPLAHRHLNTAPEGGVRFSVGYLNTLEKIKNIRDILWRVL